MSLREVVRFGRVVSALPRATSLAIAVLVVYTDEGAAEGEYFAKGDEDGVMYLSQWWNHKPRY